MKRIKKDADIIKEALEEWNADGKITSEKTEELKKDITVIKQDYASLSFYALIAAVSCIILSFGALVLDEKWIERLRRLFSLSELVIAFIFAILSGLLFLWLHKQKNNPRIGKTAIDIIYVLMVLSFGVAVAYIAKHLALNAEEFAYYMLLVAALLMLMAISLDAKLIWILFILTMIFALAANTYALSSDTDKVYFLGMNFPVRMTIICGVLLFLSFSAVRWKSLKQFEIITKYLLTVLFLLSGLLLSIFGNTTYDKWLEKKQWELIIWSVSYTLLLSTLLFLSIKNKWEVLRDVTIVFFIFNLYIRFFEYFWDKTNKGIFFAILAISFWWLSRKAENLWKKYLK